MLPLSQQGLGLALVGVESPAGLRAQVEWAARLGFRAVQLNAAAPDLRPRELDRSARRDIAALLRRASLTLTGVDLWIPPGHFVDAARAPRAIDAVEAAIDFASEVASLCGGSAILCIELPAKPEAQPVARALAERALRMGARLADHAWPIDPARGEAGPAMGVGLDPAVLLAAGADPAAQASHTATPLVSARLSDVGGGGAGRVEPGAGRLDLLAYTVALATRAAPPPLVLDLRDVARQESAAAAVLRRLGLTKD